MAIEVKVPSLGESITSGILAGWHVQEGDFVQKEQTIYELETDKITSEGLAEADGVISLKIAEGEEVAIGQVIASIDDTQQAPTVESSWTETEAKTQEDSSPSVTKNDAPQAPSVHRLASETGLDPTTLKGSGKQGRVTKGDMLEALKDKASVTDAGTTSEKEEKKGKAAQQVADVGVGPSLEERTTRKPMSSIRKRIAERLMQAQHSAAILTTFNEVDMGAIISLRKRHQERFQQKYGIKLGFMSFFVKAVVHALREVPELNAQIDGDAIVQNHYYDIGVALSAPQGLMVPVVRDCDQLSFAQVEDSLVRYAQKAKENKITLEDLSGGVFTISNGGIFGSMLSTPLLNTPQSGILGMHAIQERPVVREGEIVIRSMMNLALSYDHRIVDGREAVSFLITLKKAIEDPSCLLLEL